MGKEMCQETVGGNERWQKRTREGIEEQRLEMVEQTKKIRWKTETKIRKDMKRKDAREKVE